MRRFTRLTNAFSKKLANLKAAVALHFMHYNFARIHQTLRVTPAIAAGLMDHVWDVAEIVELLDKKATGSSLTCGNFKVAHYHFVVCVVFVWPLALQSIRCPRAV